MISPHPLLYSIENDKKFGGSLDQLNNRVIVKYTGEVAWLTPALLIAKCPMNIKYFPFDEQKCVLEFGSWTYDGSQLNIDVSYPEMSLSEYKNLFFPGCRIFDTTIDLQILNIINLFNG